MGPDAMIFVFWMLSFKPTFSLSSFTFIKRLLSSSSLSAIRVVSSVYLRWLIFLPAILIPAYVSSSPAFLITAWQIEGEKVDAVTDFLFLGSKITAHADCSHEIRKWLLLGRKMITNLDNVLKSGDITLLTKVHIVKSVVLPEVTYGCDSWTVKKAEC